MVADGLPPMGWQEIAANFPEKTQQQVMERWTKVLDPSLTKGSWTRAEDQTIVEYVRHHDAKSWTKLAAKLPGRTGKQIRERWVNHLDPDLTHAAFSVEEDRRIIELHQTYGNRWVKIASFLPTRSCNAIKNRWNSTLHRVNAPDPNHITAMPFALPDEQLHVSLLPEPDDAK
jgi:hypothetical protein